MQDFAVLRGEFDEEEPKEEIVKPEGGCEADALEPVDRGVEPQSDEKDSTEKDSTEKDSTEKDSTEKDSNEKDSNEKDSNEKDSNEKDNNEKDNNEKDSNEKDSNEKDSTEKDSNEKDSDEESKGEEGSGDVGSDEEGSDEEGSDEEGSDEGETEEEDTDESDFAYSSVQVVRGASPIGSDSFRLMCTFLLASDIISAISVCSYWNDSVNLLGFWKFIMRRDFAGTSRGRSCPKGARKKVNKFRLRLRKRLSEGFEDPDSLDVIAFIQETYRAAQKKKTRPTRYATKQQICEDTEKVKRPLVMEWTNETTHKQIASCVVKCIFRRGGRIGDFSQILSLFFGNASKEQRNQMKVFWYRMIYLYRSRDVRTTSQKSSTYGLIKRSHVKGMQKQLAFIIDGKKRRFFPWLRRSHVPHFPPIAKNQQSCAHPCSLLALYDQRLTSTRLVIAYNGKIYPGKSHGSVPCVNDLSYVYYPHYETVNLGYSQRHYTDSFNFTVRQCTSTHKATENQDFRSKFVTFTAKIDFTKEFALVNPDDAHMLLSFVICKQCHTEWYVWEPMLMKYLERVEDIMQRQKSVRCSDGSTLICKTGGKRKSERYILRKLRDMDPKAFKSKHVYTN